MLTGLVVAGEDARDDSGLRAALRVAGQTVLEHQARLLAEAGAERIILVAEQLPPALADAVTRLRRDSVPVELVRQVDELAQRVRPEERLLLLADGVVTDAAALERMIAAAMPACMILPDTPETRGWELIDATSRWAGLLLVDGDLVRRTARMLGDWELQSTLLRNAVQAGAERVPANAARVLARVDDGAAAQAVEQAISDGAARRYSGLPDRFLFDLVARLLAPRAMSAMIDPGWLRGGAAGLLILSALLFLTGWRGLGLAAALLSGPLDTLGRHLGALSMRLRRDHPRWVRLRHAAGGLALLALGWTLREFGWGTIAVSGATIAFMFALAEHERWIGRSTARPLWLAEPDTLIWLLLPFALAGWWTGGIAAQAGLAFASLLAVQRLSRRQS